MTKEKYLENRNALMNSAESLLNEGKHTDAEAKMKEVEALDAEFENACKIQANLTALKDNVKPVNLENAGVQMSGTVAEKIDSPVAETEKKEPEAYKNAWAKDLMGMKLIGEEQTAFDLVNAFTHTTENTGTVIPESVVSGIWKEIGEQYPLWNDVFKTYVSGTLKTIKSTSSSDAAWYDEDTETADGKEEFGTATLSGCELSRAITVSWKLKEMAIDEFIPYIQRQLAEKMGAAQGYGVSVGKGKPGQGDTFKEEPKGIITALRAQVGTPQIVKYSEGDPLTYKKITSAMAKIKGAYKTRAAYYANSTTIWDKLANIVDKNERPYFVANPIDGGVGTIFGKTVKEDDSIPEGAILIGDVYNGYHANINKQMTLSQEEHIKARTTDYVAYAILDGDVRAYKAFALIEADEEEEG